MGDDSSSRYTINIMLNTSQSIEVYTTENYKDALVNNWVNFCSGGVYDPIVTIIIYNAFAHEKTSVMVNVRNIINLEIIPCCKNF